MNIEFQEIMSFKSISIYQEVSEIKGFSVLDCILQWAQEQLNTSLSP